MDECHDSTIELINRAANGSDSAVLELLRTNRDRLRRMVAARIDRRLSSRIDPSDVVQDVMIEANKKMPVYLAEQPIPFYPWLRRLAWERLMKLHERHIVTQKRSVLREERWAPQLSNQSTMFLAERLLAEGPTPSGHAINRETRRRIHQALARLSEIDREFLILRYLEQLSIRDISVVLSISVGAAKARHLRALDHLRQLLDSSDIDG